MKNMDLFVDTNVIVDVFMRREPFYGDSSYIWDICANKKVHGHMASYAFATILYIMRKQMTPEYAEVLLEDLTNALFVEILYPSDLYKAVRLHWKDFEDALQFTIAKRIKADFIITRNPADFEDRSIPVLTPTEFVFEFGDGYSLIDS